MHQISDMDLVSMELHPTGKAVTYEGDEYRQYEIKHIVDVSYNKGLQQEHVKVEKLGYRAAIVGFHKDDVVTVGLHFSMGDSEQVLAVLGEVANPAS